MLSYDPLRRNKYPRNELQTTRILTVQRSSATEHARGNGIISDNVPLVVALLVTGTSDRSASLSEALLRGSTPTVTNGWPSRAPICGATNTLVEKGPADPSASLSAAAAAVAAARGCREVKRQVHSRKGHKRLQGEYSYSCIVSLPSALDGCGWSTPRLDRLTPGTDT
jgi:hypothetical protein